MSIFAYSQHDHIELGSMLSEAAVTALQFLFILLFRFERLQLAIDPVNIFRRDQYIGKQFQTNHCIITVWIIWRHHSLIGKKDIDMLPHDLFTGEYAIRSARCISSGKCNPGPAV